MAATFYDPPARRRSLQSRTEHRPRYNGCQRVTSVQPTPPTVAPSRPSRNSDFAWAALLLLATLIAYLPLWRAGFVWDDDSILTRNPLIKAPDGLWRIWFTTDAPDYWPITYTSFWLEWRLWGESALGYHLTNLALHLAEVFFAWRILRRLGIPGARWAALLFALHPVNVETVAWIAQRKNLTAMLFLLLAIWCYTKLEDEQPTVKDAVFPRGTGRWYIAAFLAFVAAVLGKGSAVVLPALLLTIVAYRRRLTWADALRIAPFFAAAGFLALLNVWFQFHGSGEVVRHEGFTGRLLGAAAAIWFYLGKALGPFDLSFVYPRWQIEPTDILWWLPLAAAVAATVTLWQMRRRVGAGPLCAWTFFGFALLPALGFADIYFMRYSLVADHYQHVALLGVATFVAAAWSTWHARLAPRLAQVSLFTAVFIVVALATLTFRQAQDYRNSTTIWRATLEKNPTCWLALTILGNNVADAGNPPAALAYQKKAVALNPDSFEVQYNLGNVLGKLGRDAEAIPHYRKSLALRPNDAPVHYALGKALQVTGERDAAMTEYHRALIYDPKLVEARLNLGIALIESGDAAAGKRHFEVAVRYNPNSATAHYNLGYMLQIGGDVPAAIEHYRTAIRLRPGYADAERNLAIAVKQLSGTR